MIHNPEESLKALEKTLSSFGKVSGYRINEGKSIFGLNIGTQPSRNIQAFHCTPWKHVAKYLGVKSVILLTNEALVNVNWVPLVENIE